MRISFLGLLFLTACGSSTTTLRDNSAPRDQRIVEMQKKIDELALVASTITEGINNPFSDCSSVVNAMEKKICQIASTFDAQQQLETKSQLGEMAKILQTALFGADCINNTDIGCPAAGSIDSRVALTESAIAGNTASIASINNSITNINTSLTSLSSRVSALENRLNNFNGSGQTAEVFVAGIKSDVVSLQNQIADIQGLITSDRILQAFQLCGDNVDSGPVYELILISGDKAKAYGYVKTGTAEGSGLFFKAGDANLGFNTHINSKICHFKMYNNTTNTKVQACWINSNRAATNAQIDAARTASTATCTPF